MFKFTRPPDEYVMIRYRNGEEINSFPTHWYITTKEAYNTWYYHKTSIKINHWFTGRVYTLSSNADILMYKFGTSGEWRSAVREHLKKMNPDAWAYWCSEKEWQQEAPMVKSEPTPDHYYVGYREILGPEYFLVPRNFIKNGGSDYITTWKGDRTSKQAKYVYDYPEHWYKKFPQLSSEVKAELQKQNPERYKEWEEFYMKKYPNMQSLSTKPDLPNPADDYIVIEANEFALVQRSKFIEGVVQWVYRFNYGWVEAIAKKGNHGENVWPCIKDWNKCRGISDILPQFEQYYSELEQKKELKYQLNGRNPNDFYFYTVGRGWEAIRKEGIDRYSGNSKEKVLLISIRDGSTRYVRRCDIQTPLSIWPQIANDHPFGKCLTFKQQNEQLFNEWKGSDLDIDEKTMEKNWLEIAAKLSDGPKIGKVVCFGTETDGDHSGLMEMFKDPRSYNVLSTPGIGKTNWFTAGIDPYQADYETNVSQSIWGRDLYGKLVNRLTELKRDGWVKDSVDWFRNNRATPLEFELEAMNHARYYGIVNLKARRIGQTTADREWAKLEQTLNSLPGFIQVNKQYSPNLKQQNDEIINVPRKIITVTCGQEYTGNSISSYRCPPTVAKEHTGNRPEPCRGKESSRSSKIG